MTQTTSSSTKPNISDSIYNKVNSSGGIKKSKLTLLVMFLLAVSIPIVIAFYFQKPPEINKTSTTPTENNGFNPTVSVGKETSVRGKIKGASADEKNYKYYLEGSNSETIGYLFSPTIDLSTSEGFLVEVRGSITANYNGSMVIKVNELVLK